MIERRGFLTGLVGFVAAPAIVRASSLMPVKPMREIITLPFDLPTELRYLGDGMFLAKFQFGHMPNGTNWKLHVDERSAAA